MNTPGGIIQRHRNEDGRAKNDARGFSCPIFLIFLSPKTRACIRYLFLIIHPLSLLMHLSSGQNHQANVRLFLTALCCFVPTKLCAVATLRTSACAERKALGGKRFSSCNNSGRENAILTHRTLGMKAHSKI